MTNHLIMQGHQPTESGDSILPQDVPLPKHYMYSAFLLLRYFRAQTT